MTDTGLPLCLLKMSSICSCVGDQLILRTSPCGPLPECTPRNPSLASSSNTTRSSKYVLTLPSPTAGVTVARPASTMSLPNDVSPAPTISTSANVRLIMDTK